MKEKETNQLQQIANILWLNVQRVKTDGLLQGKLGIALFFYQYARYTGDKQYIVIAEAIVESVQQRLTTDSPYDFANGLSGIGWGIDYLIKERFLEADDDILDEVDTAIQKIAIRDFYLEMELPIPLFSKGLYFLQRNKQEIMEETISQLAYFLQQYPTAPMPALYKQSILCFLQMAINQKIAVDTCTKLLNRFDSFGSYPLSLYSSKDLFSCLIPQEIDLSEHLEQVRYDHLSIYNGLSGTGLYIINNFVYNEN